MNEQHYKDILRFHTKIAEDIQNIEIKMSREIERYEGKARCRQRIRAPSGRGICCRQSKRSWARRGGCPARGGPGIGHTMARLAAAAARANSRQAQR